MNGFKHHPWQTEPPGQQPGLEQQVREEFLEESSSEDCLRAARGIANAATIVVALVLFALFVAHFTRSAVLLFQQ